MGNTLVGLAVAAMMTSPATAVASPAGEAPLVELQVPTGTISSSATAVNNRGAVVGGVTLSDWTVHPVKWDARGRITILPAVPDYFTYAVDIDEDCLVSGYWLDRSDFGHAVVWDRTGKLIQLPSLAPGSTWLATSHTAGKFVGASAGPDGRQHAVSWDRRWRVTDLGIPPGATSSGAEAINDAGIIVGEVQTDHFTLKPVMWDQRGQIHELASSGATSESASAINNAGVVLGLAVGPDSTNYTAVRWDRNGRPTSLGFPFGVTSVYPFWLNERGTIVGLGFFGPAGTPGGVRWDRHDRAVKLAGLSETDYSGVNAVNDHDITVGTSWNATTYRAVYWDRLGQVHAMAALPGSNWSVPSSVNDHGLVAGSCQDPATGNYRAVLWHIGD